MIKNWFVSPDDDRIRAGWRLLVQFFILLTFVIIISLITQALGVSPSASDTPQKLLLQKFIELIAFGGSVYLARRYWDRRSFESLGLQDRSVGKDMLTGIGVSFLMITLINLILVLGGYTSFEGFGWNNTGVGGWLGSIFFLFASFILIAFNEELVFRGYQFVNIEEGLNTRWAVILTSLLFTLAHLENPSGGSFLPIVGILLAGLFFAYAYLRTRTLWLVIGLHFGWNFSLSVIFGLTVSGLNFPSIVKQSVSGPELITGGSFGPEAGLVLLPALLLGWWLVRRYTQDRS
jgi:membrane protease YdiL (CAAX protease family)